MYIEGTAGGEKITKIQKKYFSFLVIMNLYWVQTNHGKMHILAIDLNDFDFKKVISRLQVFLKTGNCQVHLIN